MTEALLRSPSTLLPALEASGFVGAWETDLDAGIVYPSERFADLLGLPAEATTEGVPLAVLLEGVHAADRERVGTLVHKAHHSAGRFEAEFRTLSRSGVTRWVAARGQVETDPQGRGLRCLGIAVDVTDTRLPSLEGPFEAIRTLSQIADTALAARRLADALDSSVLRTLLDILLLELGRELAKASNRADRLH